MSICFAASKRADMRPLTCHSIPVGECHTQLTDLLSRYRKVFHQQGIRDAGPFFAEPVSDPDGNSIDWYGADGDEPKRVADLTGPQKQQAQALIARYAKALDIITRDLESKPAQSMHASVLRTALKHPAPSDLYVQGGKILLVNWGYESGVEGAAPEDIIRGTGFINEPPASEKAQPVPPNIPSQQQDTLRQAGAPSSVPARGCLPVVLPSGCAVSGCLPWLLPILLLSLLILLVLSMIGHAPKFIPNTLFRQTVDTHSVVRSYDAAKSEVTVLYQQLQERMLLCQRPGVARRDAVAPGVKYYGGDTAVIPGTGVVPETPVDPGVGIVPGTGVTPEVPVDPGAGVVPETPVDRGTGVVPETPVDRGTGVVPETPVDRGTGVVPETPVDRGTGVVPETPVDRGTGAVPDARGTVPGVAGSGEAHAGAGADASSRRGAGAGADVTPDFSGGAGSGADSDQSGRPFGLVPYFGSPDPVDPGRYGSDRGDSSGRSAGRQGSGQNEGSGSGAGRQGTGQNDSPGSGSDRQGAGQSRQSAQDMGGCWRSQDPLYKRSTNGSPLVLEYCFRGNGTGTRSLYDASTGEKLCTGGTSVRYNPHNVDINAGTLNCQGVDYAPQYAQCARVGGVVECTGKERLKGRNNTWIARFTRPSY